MEDLKNRIQKLKKEKNAVILAHYYVDGAVQEIADYIGDSYYLSDMATRLKEQVLVFCGVTFMGESAKILNPEKTVLLPEPEALCPMAEMAQISHIEEMKEKIPDLAVVCYINSTAKIKTVCDVCVTSANALTVVSKLPNRNILFVPDGNLGRYIAEKLPDKQFFFNDGYCHVHQAITEEHVVQAKKAHPGLKFLVHPECRPRVSAMADYVGSTSGIIRYADECEDEAFLVATETGVFYEMQKRNPDKKFYPVKDGQICTDMKKITLEKVYDCLNEMKGQVQVSDEIRLASEKPLKRMLELAKKEA